MPIRFLSSLRGRLLTLITAVFAALFVALLLFHAQAKQHDRDEALSRALDLAKGFANHYDRLLRDGMILLDTVLKLPGFDPNDAAGCNRTFRHIVAANPSLVNLVALDAAGHRRCAARDAEPDDDSSLAALRRAIESHDTIVGMSGESRRLQGRAFVTLARPLTDGAGRIHTVIVAYLDRDWLNARFAETVPAGVVLRILDGNGIFVVRQPNPECCVGKSGMQLFGVGEALASGREQVVQSRWLDGVLRLQADLPLKPPLSGVVSIGVPEEVVQSAASRKFAHLTGLLAVLCVASYLVIWFFTNRYILRPVGALSASVRSMRAGRLEARVPVLPGNDEFAELGMDFNEMAATLEERRHDLAESERRLRLALGAARMAVWEWDVATDTLIWGAHPARLLGREPAGGYPDFRDMVHADDREAFLAAGRRAVAEGTPYRAEFRIVSTDGDVRWIEAKGMPEGHERRLPASAGAEGAGPASAALPPAAAEGGEVLRLRGVSQDVTERKQLQLLRAGERDLLERVASDGESLPSLLDGLARNYEALFPGMTCAILLLADDDTHTRVAAAPGLPQAMRQSIEGRLIGPLVCGCVTGAMSGRRIVVTDIASDPCCREHRELALAHGLQSCWSVPILSSRGGETVLGAMVMYYQEPRSPTTEELAVIERGAFLANLAIERHRAQEAQRLAASVFEQANEAISITDGKANILAINRRFTAITGYRADEAIGRNPRILQSGRQDAAFYRAMWDALLGQGHWSGEIWNRRKDGTVYPEWLSISAVRDADGRTTNYVAVFSDLTERKAAEQAARESASLMRLILDTTLDAVISMGRDGRILEWNAEAERMFGYPKQVALKSSVADLIVPPRLRDAHNAGMRRFLETGEGRVLGRRIEITAMRADGGEFPVELAIATVNSETGLFFSAFIRDISERKAAEERIRASELRYRSMIENAPEGVWIIGADECTIEVNRRMCELLGYAPQEMAGRRPTDFTDPANGMIFERQKALRATTRHRIYEVALRHRDGRNIPVNFSATSLYREDGALHSVLAFVTDLSERISAERRLRESEARLASLIEAIPDPIFLKDGDSRWQVINSAANSLFRIEGLAWQGRTDKELALMQPEYSGEHMACWESDEAAWANGCVTHSTEFIHKGEAGVCVLDVCKVPLFDDAGNRNALVILGRDITEQHRFTEELRRINDELESRVTERTQALLTANRELEAFSYSVSHDLRAPLRAINGFSHLIEEEYAASLDDKARNYLSRVRAGSERMGQLIDDLLHLSQMSRQPMHVVPTNLSEIAREIAGEFQAGDPQRRAEWDIAGDIVACGDAGLLRAVLLNLLGNAWKYSSRQETPRIAFGVAEKNGRATYFVRDNGAGFDMAHSAKLFGAFQRLHSPAEFPGSGIGLATVARIIHRHGGEVWAEGRVGEGATFYFTLNAQSVIRNA